MCKRVVAINACFGYITVLPHHLIIRLAPQGLVVVHHHFNNDGYQLAQQVGTHLAIDCGSLYCSR
jgi:hypothetical protein